MNKLTSSHLSLFTLLVCIAFVVNSCSVNPVTGKRELMLLNEDQEKALGLQSDPGIIAQYGLYQDEALQKFINEKGREMGKISHRPNLDYQFRILDSPVVNAFAVPGGFVYFTRGIMAHFNNEAEFAGVLGHEIGHITARHSASQYSKSVLAQLGLVVGMAVSEDFRQYGGLAQTGVGLLFLKFGRDDESQSDKLGVEYSTKVGYDAHEMADFFGTLKRLSDKSGQSIPTFLSTHPDPGDRNRKVKEMASQWQRNLDAQKLRINRDQYLQMINGLVYGEDPRQGFVENGYFYHPELKFQFPIPSNWRTVNTPQQVQMAPEDGNALMLLTLGKGKTLQASADSVLAQFKLNVLNRRNASVGGYPALVISGVTQPQQNQQTGQTQEPIQMLTYLIQYNGLIYNFIGMTYQSKYGNYQNSFARTMENFKVLRDKEKLNRQPERIKISRVPRSGTLENAFRALKVPANRFEELSIINGMTLKDQVQQGMLLKTLQ